MIEGMGVKVAPLSTSRSKALALSLKALHSYAHALDEFTMLATRSAPVLRVKTTNRSFRSPNAVGTARRTSRQTPFLPRSSSSPQDEDKQRRGRGLSEGDRVGDAEDPDLYIGTYSNFFSDPEQLKGVVIFCAFLLSFFSLGNVGAAIILPLLYGTDDTLSDFCIQSLLFGYYCN
jgi:hypothetical protein